jgi:anti-sigma factor RsiW
MPAVTCDEGRIVAFLNGQLSGPDEQAFDEHLLNCEACWRAIREDRLGRLALEQLRVSAPAGLADRVTLLVGLAGQEERHPQGHPARPGLRGRSRFVRMGAGAALALAVFGAVMGWALQGRSVGDPPQIAKVVAMEAPKMADSPALRNGEQFDFGGQPLTVRSFRVEGVITLVATSTRPFPMPGSSHLLAGSSFTAWMATHGKLAMYGVNRPGGDPRGSMFLVAAMPMAQLPQVAARLHLI